MKIHDIETRRSELADWVSGVLQRSDLAAGRVECMPVEVRALRDLEYLVTVELETLSRGPLEAEHFNDLDDYLTYVGADYDYLATVDGGLLQAVRPDPMIAVTDRPDLAYAAVNETSCVSAALYALERRDSQSIPSFPFAPPSYCSAAIGWNEIVYVHHHRADDLVVEPAFHFRLDGPSACISLTADAATPRMSPGS